MLLEGNSQRTTPERGQQPLSAEDAIGRILSDKEVTYINAEGEVFAINIACEQTNVEGMDVSMTRFTFVNKDPKEAVYSVILRTQSVGEEYSKKKMNEYSKYEVETTPIIVDALTEQYPGRSHCVVLLSHADPPALPLATIDMEPMYGAHTNAGKQLGVFIESANMYLGLPSPVVFILRNMTKLTRAPRTVQFGLSTKKGNVESTDLEKLEIIISDHRDNLGDQVKKGQLPTTVLEFFEEAAILFRSSADLASMHMISQFRA